MLPEPPCGALRCNSYNKAAMTRCKCELIGQNTRPEVQRRPTLALLPRCSIALYPTHPCPEVQIKADSIQQAAASASAPQQMEQAALDARP